MPRMMEGDSMRKTMLLITVVALIVLSAVPAIAKRVINESHKEFQIQAYMGSDDGSTNGGAWAAYGSNGTMFGIDFNRNYDCEVLAEDAVQWEGISGEGNLDSFTVSPTKGKTKFTSGEATGTFSSGEYNSQLCNGEQGDSYELDGNHTFFITMNGEGGSLVRTSGSNSWHIPSETNNHSNEKGLMRLANGSVSVDGIHIWAGDGSIGQHSWSQHTNE
jgi:hypothetical protein